MAKHVCKFVYSYRSGTNIGFRCNGCSETKQRKATRAEWRVATAGFEKGKHIHRVYHNYMKKFRDDKGNYKLTGYELMVAIARWAKRYPDDVRVTSCDDDYFMSSEVVYIQHRTHDSYMGTSVIFIPQKGDQPNEMFLYPHALEAMLRTLIFIKKDAKPVLRAARIAQRHREQITSKWRL